MFFILFNRFVSEQEFIQLKTKRELLTEQIQSLIEELNSTNKRFDFLSSIYDPKFTIITAKRPDGVKYIARFKVEVPKDEFYGFSQSIKSDDLKKGGVKNFSITLGDVDEFKGKDDPKLMKIARERSFPLIKSKIPEIFS